jgi:hypothetical protein
MLKDQALEIDFVRSDSGIFREKFSTGDNSQYGVTGADAPTVG